MNIVEWFDQHQMRISMVVLDGTAHQKRQNHHDVHDIANVLVAQSMGSATNHYEEKRKIH